MNRPLDQCEYPWLPATEMNVDKFEGLDVDVHLSADTCHVKDPHGTELGADDRLHRGPSDVSVSSVSKGATTKLSTELAKLSDSSSEGMKQKDENISTIQSPLSHYKYEMLINASRIIGSTRSSGEG